MNDKTDYNGLYRAIMQCRNETELEKFMRDLCTPAELGALNERWMIALLLDREKLSYREISKKTGASTTTIGRVARFLSQEPHKGYSLVLARLSKTQQEKNGETEI